MMSSRKRPTHNYLQLPVHVREAWRYFRAHSRRDLARRTESPNPQVIPTATQVCSEDVSRLTEFVTKHPRLAVLTGAGLSTESGIPDYRSPGGAYATGFKPMKHQEFMEKESSRSRYWFRSFVGWHQFAEQTMPNNAHYALAQLQARGKVGYTRSTRAYRAGFTFCCILSVQTLAGCAVLARNLSEVHRCGDCSHKTLTGFIIKRVAQRRLAEANPSAAHTASLANQGFSEEARRGALNAVGHSAASRTTSRPGMQRPDGDIELSPAECFQVVPCGDCGSSMMKPDVVFFGDNLPQERSALTKHIVQEADALLVIGSSVAVFSAFRLTKMAKKLAILNVGETRADALAELKVEALAGEVLPKIASSVV